MAKVFELMEDENSYHDCLELALENKSTLTFDVGAIKQELKEIENEK